MMRRKSPVSIQTFTDTVPSKAGGQAKKRKIYLVMVSISHDTNQPVLPELMDSFY